MIHRPNFVRRPYAFIAPRIPILAVLALSAVGPGTAVASDDVPRSPAPQESPARAWEHAKAAGSKS